MVYFFHHYELPAILQQARIRHLFNQAQQRGNQPQQEAAGQQNNVEANVEPTAQSEQNATQLHQDAPELRQGVIETEESLVQLPQSQPQQLEQNTSQWQESAVQVQQDATQPLENPDTFLSQPSTYLSLHSTCNNNSSVQQTLAIVDSDSKQQQLNTASDPCSASLISHHPPQIANQDKVALLQASSQPIECKKQDDLLTSNNIQPAVSGSNDSCLLDSEFSKKQVLKQPTVLEEPLSSADKGLNKANPGTIVACDSDTELVSNVCDTYTPSLGASNSLSCTNDI